MTCSCYVHELDVEECVVGGGGGEGEDEGVEQREDRAAEVDHEEDA